MHDKVNNRSAGTLIGLLAALVGLLCFFLPWLEANLFGQSGSVSGFEMATKTGGRSMNVKEWSLLVIPASMLVAALVTLAALLRKERAGGLSRAASLALIAAGSLSAGIILYHVFDMNADLNRDMMGRLVQQVVRITYLPAGYAALVSALVALVGGALNLRPARQAGPLPTPAMTGDASLASASAPATFANPPVMNPPMPFSAPAAATKGSPRMICSKCGKPIPATGRFCTGCGAGIAEAVPAPSPQTYAPTRLSGPAAAGQAAQADPMVGQVIDGKYRLETQLGAGGMGTVYRATRLLIGDAVAVKLLHADQVADAQAVERFRREAQAAARLKHPNAVTIYDFGVADNGLVFLAMELVEGRSLREIIKQQGPLTPTAAAEIMKQACAALDEAHRQRIIHRDVKPDNIVVAATPEGLSVKVLDFGIAKLRDLAATASNLTQTGSVVGTPHYMSPEQCLGEELDHRSDIYSLGIVLYEALTGIAPFNSPTSAAVVVQQVTQPPPPLRSLNLTISPAVEAVVLHALEKRREARPQTAGALAQEMSAAAQGTMSYSPVSRTDWNAAPTLPASGGTAPALAATMQMPVTPRSSGSVTPANLSPFPSGPQSPAWGTAITPAPSSSARRHLPLLIGGAAVVVVAVGLIIFFNLASAKKALLNEVKKGNLVKPEGSSAYDLYQKNAASLSAADKTEITDEVLPALEKRGDEIITQLKQEANESEAEWAEAIRVFGWLNELKPKPFYESRKLFAQARLEYLKKDYDKSISDFQRSIGLDPSWALSLNGIGRAYLANKDKARAREYYGRATTVDPNWIYPWINLAGLCLELNDPYGAQDAAQHALAIDPQKASAHNFLAQAYDKLYRGCDAVREYKLALDYAYNASSTTSNFNLDNARSKMEKLRTQYSCYAMGD